MASSASSAQTGFSFNYRLLVVLLNQPVWVTRTVEAVSFVDRHTVRRRISRHYALPEEHVRPYLPGTKTVRLPVFAISKGQFISCDLADESRMAIALPPLPERSLHSAEALEEYVRQLGHDSQAVRDHVRAFVTGGPESSHQALKSAEADSVMKPLFGDPRFDYLAHYLAYNYVVYIDIDASHPGPPRRMIRFQLDTRFPHTGRELRQWQKAQEENPSFPSLDWSSRQQGIKRVIPRVLRTWLRLLGLMSFPFHHFVRIDGAGSSHFDVAADDGIAFAKRQLRIRNDVGVAEYESRGASSRRARFLVPRRWGRGSAAMTVYIRPAPGLLRNGSFFLLAAFAILLYAADCEYAKLVERSAAVSLLFLLPGLVSVVATRQNEHPYVSGVLAAIRTMVVLPIPLGVLVAFDLLTKGPQWIIGASALLSAACAAILLLGRIIDEFKTRPGLSEFVLEDLTRIG